MSAPEEPFAALEQVANRQVKEEEAIRAIVAARAKLILGRDAKSVFFATLLLRLRSKPNWSAETMETDGRELSYNPEFVTSLSASELQGVLAHEVMHNALAHSSRRGLRDTVLWNIACDLAINPILREAGMSLPLGHLVPGEGKYAELQAGKSAEEYYSTLLSNKKGGSNDDNGQSRDPGRCGQVCDAESSDPATNHAVEVEWNIAVAQAQQAAQQRGALPTGLGRTIEKVLNPPADWRCILRDFISTHARNDYSWMRLNRRMLAQGLYLPGLQSEELGQIVLAIDTSGSISETMLGVFAEEINAILGTYECSAIILYHDTEIQGFQLWQSSDGPLHLEPEGGGGTSHECVFDWLSDSDERPACVICLTDLWTDFPSEAPDVPVLWAVTPGGGEAAPFGQIVHLTL